VIVFRGRREAAENLVEEIGTGAFEHRFEPVELTAFQVRERGFGERAQNKVAFLRLAMPAAEKSSRRRKRSKSSPPRWSETTPRWVIIASRLPASCPRGRTDLSGPIWYSLHASFRFFAEVCFGAEGSGHKRA
jgi:hypothetical protein